MLLTRAPLYWPPCGGFRARLACVRHAASVDSEPGSNSQKELPSGRSNCPPSLTFEWPPRLITRNDFTSGVFHPVVKQRSPRPEAKGAPWGANRFYRRQNRPRTFAATAPRSHTADPRSRFLRGLQQALRLREAGRFHRPGTTTAPVAPIEPLVTLARLGQPVNRFSGRHHPGGCRSPGTAACAPRL